MKMILKYLHIIPIGILFSMFPIRANSQSNIVITKLAIVDSLTLVEKCKGPIAGDIKLYGVKKELKSKIKEYFSIKDIDFGILIKDVNEINFTDEEWKRYKEWTGWFYPVFEIEFHNKLKEYIIISKFQVEILYVGSACPESDVRVDYIHKYDDFTTINVPKKNGTYNFELIKPVKIEANKTSKILIRLMPQLISTDYGNYWVPYEHILRFNFLFDKRTIASKIIYVLF